MFLYSFIAIKSMWTHGNRIGEKLVFFSPYISFIGHITEAAEQSP